MNWKFHCDSLLLNDSVFPLEILKWDRQLVLYAVLTFFKLFVKMLLNRREDAGGMKSLMRCCIFHFPVSSPSLH